MLFTSVGRRVELVRAFRRAYAELGLAGSIVGVDIDPLAPALQECDVTYMVPRCDEAGYVPAVLEVCRDERVALLFPLIDPEIPVLAAARERFEAEAVRPMVLRVEAARIVADKRATAELLERIGVPVPRWWPADRVRTGELELPAFVKPRFGSAGMHAHAVHDRHELEFWLRTVPEPIVQELVTGAEITSDVICLDDGRAAAVVSRERLEVRAGEVAKGRTVHDERIVTHCVAIASALQGRGPLTVQCILADGEPRFTEVNPRFAGGVPLAIAAGMRAPEWLLAQAAGLAVDLPSLGTYQTDLHMTRFDDSFFLSEGDRAGLLARRV